MIEGIQACIDILKSEPIHDPIFKAALLQEVRQRANENFADLLECIIDTIAEQK